MVKSINSRIDVLKKEQVQIEHELPEYVRLTELTTKLSEIKKQLSSVKKDLEAKTTLKKQLDEDIALKQKELQTLTNCEVSLNKLAIKEEELQKKISAFHHASMTQKRISNCSRRFKEKNNISAKYYRCESRDSKAV